MGKGRGSEDGLFQGVKGGVLPGRPIEVTIAHDSGQGGGDGREVRDKSAEIISKTIESASFGSVTGRRQFGDGLLSFRINGDTGGVDDVSQVLERGGKE